MHVTPATLLRRCLVPKEHAAAVPTHEATAGKPEAGPAEAKSGPAAIGAVHEIGVVPKDPTQFCLIFVF